MRSSELPLLVICDDVHVGRDAMRRRGLRPREYELVTSSAGVQRRIRGTRGRRYTLVLEREAHPAWLDDARAVLAATEATLEPELTSDVEARVRAELHDQHVLDRAAAPDPEEVVATMRANGLIDPEDDAPTS